MAHNDGLRIMVAELARTWRLIPEYERIERRLHEHVWSSGLMMLEYAASLRVRPVFIFPSGPSEKPNGQQFSI